MPYTGQNIYKSALVDSRQRSIDKIQDVRSGNWNRVLPEQTSSGKYMSSKASTREFLRSGQAFRGNVANKQSELNQRSISGFLQRKQAIDQG